MRTGHQVTLSEVAKKAGVSIATASRVINGSSGRKVNPEIRATVESAAEELGYIPNSAAQTVARGNSALVAVLVADIADPYFSSIVSGIMKRAGESDLVVNLGATGHSASSRAELIRGFRIQRPHTIVVVGTRTDDEAGEAAVAEQLAAFEASGGHVVEISQAPSAFDLVEIRNRAGAADLARVLVARGGSRFGIVCGRRSLWTNKDRVDGFREGLAISGVHLDEDRIVEADFSRDGGYAATRELLAAHPDIDTLFAASDVMAHGAATALRELGREPGADVSLAGFDDIPTCLDITPPLTTVRVPLAEIGYQALHLALRPRIEATEATEAMESTETIETSESDGATEATDAGKSPERTHLPIETTVVIRESTPERHG